jgi:hypothetical protein
MSAVRRGRQTRSVASADGELLDPQVHRVRDVQAVERYPVRQVEATGFGPFPSDAVQVLAVVRLSAVESGRSCCDMAL